MTQFSYPWAGSSTGDAGPYSDDQWSDMRRDEFMYDRQERAVLQQTKVMEDLGLNELAVSGAASPVDVESGVAIVDGKRYRSDAAEEVTIPTPASNTRIDRIVLEKDWTAQTVRIARIEGTEGGAAPALTRTDGTLWQVPLAQVSITTGGTITVTDERKFARPAVDAMKNAVAEPFPMRTDVAVEVGDDKGRLPIPDWLDGYRLAYIVLWVKTAPSGGPTELQVHNITQAVDLLSTTATVDAGETSSRTAATQPVINSANAIVNAGDVLRFDYDQANGAVGSQVELGFVPA